MYTIASAPSTPAARDRQPDLSASAPTDRGVIKDLLQRKNEVGPKLLIVLVGLPARGKSYICKKVKRYLAWLGFNVAVFNVGNRRRVTAIEEAKRDHKAVDHSSQFFDPNNKDASNLRDRLAMDTLEELIGWLHKGGKVAFHDATNTTQIRRNMIVQRVRQERDIKVLFLESICNDEKVLQSNINMKLLSPDYKSMEPTAAIADFTARMKNYERAYQPLGDYEDQMGMSYIKVVDVGKKVIASNIQGYIASQVVFYLMNIHIKERTIWLTRHGESAYNQSGRIGGNPHLTSSGRKYANALSRFFDGRYVTNYARVGSHYDPTQAELPSVIKSQSTFTTEPQEQTTIAISHYDENNQDTKEQLSSIITPTPASLLVNTKRTRFASSSILDWNTDLLEDLDQPYGYSPSDISLASLHVDTPDETHLHMNGNNARGNSNTSPAPSSASDSELSSAMIPAPVESALDDCYHGNASDEMSDNNHAPQYGEEYALLACSEPISPQSHITDQDKNGYHLIPSPLPQLTVWTSMLTRAIETVRKFSKKSYYLRHSKLLNEIYSGFYENMTPEEIEATHPGEIARREVNKLCYRYPGPGGESYLDVIERLKPVIIETERITGDLLIVTHNVVARIMLAYYLGVPLEEMPTMDVPLYTLYALDPKPYGTDLEKWRYDSTAECLVKVE